MQAFGNDHFQGAKTNHRYGFWGITGRSIAFWNEAGKIILEQKVSTTPEAMKQALEKYAESHRPGDRNTFAVGKPAVSGTGPRSDRSDAPKVQ